MISKSRSAFQIACLLVVPLGLGCGGADPAPATPAMPAAVNGLEPTQVQKVVRGDFDRFRKCYEAGLGRNRNLQGRVAVKFVVDLEGHVSSAEDFESTMPDAEVVRCVMDGYRSLQFPKPTGKPVTIVYPIIFNPGD